MAGNMSDCSRDMDIIQERAVTAIKRQGLTEILTVFADGSGHSVASTDSIVVQQWDIVIGLLDDYGKTIKKLER